MNNSILNVLVSCFENCQSTVPKEICLLNWLTHTFYKEKVEQLRGLQDESLQKIIKASLPAITPSGLFSHRSEKDLVKHSGFIAFDIDYKDNLHIDNFHQLKEQLSKIPNVAYCGLSVRGKGFWGLVPVPESTPDIHKQRFASLAKDFKVFGINLDPSGKDVCRLRIYSWDPHPYFNHNAKVYTKILPSLPVKTIRPDYSDTRDRVEAIIEQIKSNRIDITQAYEDEWFMIASGLANEFGEGGRGYFHTVSMFHPEYNATKTDRMFDSVLKKAYSKISIGSFFKIASDYGINIKQRDQIANQLHKGDNLKALNEISKPGAWSKEITELESFFASAQLPKSMQLNRESFIPDLAFTIQSELSVVKAQNGNNRFKVDLERLQCIMKLLSN